MMDTQAAAPNKLPDVEIVPVRHGDRVVGRALLELHTDGTYSIRYGLDEAIVARGDVEFWWEPGPREIRTRVIPFQS